MVYDNINLKELLISLSSLSKEEGCPRTLLGVSSNSKSVVRASLRSAKRLNAPMYFVSTLNQVDRDGGYTGWTHHDFAEFVAQESKKINFELPVVLGIDHGGPWQKDLHSLENYSYEESMAWVKDSLESAIAAGYRMIHLDPTVDKSLPEGQTLPVEEVVRRTIELLEHCEALRERLGLPPLSYEVGTEEVHGGMTQREDFCRFVELFDKALRKRDLQNLWPCFVVGQVGTDLHTTTFEPDRARELAEVLNDYGSFLKVHYSDNVDCPSRFPEAGIGGANVGPEFTEREYEGLLELLDLEESLWSKGCLDSKSEFYGNLREAVVDSGRWKKWLTRDEKDKAFDQLDPERQEWLLKTGSRYVWAQGTVDQTREQLYENVSRGGFQPERIVSGHIERAVDKYLSRFNLVNLGRKLPV
ncbi:MAG: class II D-tagatose-bisphosphate aldolase non-catalytic subunit [Candidatus Acetothermia bacterium]